MLRPSALRHQAAQHLERSAYSPKKLVLLHTALALGSFLLTALINYLLSLQIADTGGLGGLGTRSVLSTLQSCLQLSQVVLLPFWQVGYTFVTLKFARKEAAAPTDLCRGFGLFLPMLRLLLLQGLLYLGIGFVASQLGSFLFMLTPWAAPMMEATMEIMYGSGSVEDMTYAMEKMMAEAAVPLMICSAIVFIAAAAPFFYRFRQAQLILLDEPEKGALYAMRTSWQRMRGSCMALFRLDLSFLWFYLLDLLVTLICYADWLLASLGVTLPVDPTLAFFSTFILYLVAQLVLYWWRKNEVSTTYAVFYDALKQPKETAETPQNLPWS